MGAFLLWVGLTILLVGFVFLVRRRKVVWFKVMVSGLVMAVIGGWILGNQAGAAKSSASDLTGAACRANLRCWANRNLIDASVACESAVENLARYQTRWTDGFMQQKFDHMAWFDQAKGILVYAGDHIQFQNGFGAWSTYAYRCVYDPTSKKVLTVRATQGRLSN